MIAPATMMAEPTKMVQRLPNLSLTTPTKGSDKMAPREYAAAMMPLSSPLNSPSGLSPKSASGSSQPGPPVAQQVTLQSHTLLPRGHNLEGVDHLRVEARGELNTKTCWQEHEVERPQILLPVPGDGVLVGQSLDNGVGRTRLGLPSRLHDVWQRRIHTLDVSSAAPWARRHK